MGFERDWSTKIRKQRYVRVYPKEVKCLTCDAPFIAHHPNSRRCGTQKIEGSCAHKQFLILRRLGDKKHRKWQSPERKARQKEYIRVYMRTYRKRHKLNPTKG